MSRLVGWDGRVGWPIGRHGWPGWGALWAGSADLAGSWEGRQERAGPGRVWQEWARWCCRSWLGGSGSGWAWLFEL